MKRRQQPGLIEPHDSIRTTTQRGSNQKGMRAFNERLVLTLVRRHGSLAKAQIAKITGLSAQTVSVIMRALEAEELLIRGTPRRGRVGQPMVPLSLNPDGVFSLGLMIGRRSHEMMLMDFTGVIRDSRRITFPYPTAGHLLEFTASASRELIDSLPRAHRGRVAALGVASPFNIWDWGDIVGAPPDTMNEWRDFDIRREIEAILPLPVCIQNDATAACGAELMLGRGGEFSEFLYFFIGLFAGGGVVINGSLYPGRTGNAGALASMPVPGNDGTSRSLLDSASIVRLESEIRAANEDPDALWRQRGDWSEVENQDRLRQWTENAASNLAFAIAAACSVIDFAAVVIDGSFPESIRAELCNSVRRELDELGVLGIDLPKIVEGQVGSGARAIGAACLPMFERYLLDQTNLLNGQAG